MAKRRRGLKHRVKKARRSRNAPGESKPDTPVRTFRKGADVVLTRESGGLPAGHRGTVIGAAEGAPTVAVDFGKWGRYLVSVGSLRPAEE